MPADWQATFSVVRAQLQKVYLFSKLEVTQCLHDALWYLHFMKSVADVINVGKSFDSILPKKRCLMGEGEMAKRQEGFRRTMKDTGSKSSDHLGTYH